MNENTCSFDWCWECCDICWETMRVWVSRRCQPSKSHLREKSRSHDIAIAARGRLLTFLWHQFHNFARNISPESRSPPHLSLIRLLVRSWPYRLAPAAGESCDAHICPIPCSLCHLMYLFGTMNHDIVLLFGNNKTMSWFMVLNKKIVKKMAHKKTHKGFPGFELST